MTLPFTRDALSRFIVQAKRQTYAGPGDDATIAPLLSGTRQLEYRDGPFFYRDGSWRRWATFRSCSPTPYAV